MAVIGANGDDGVIAEFGVVADAVEEAGELFVHGIEDALVEFAFAPAPFIERWPERSVDVIGPEVEVEGVFHRLGVVDELEGFIDKAGGDFESLHPLEAVAETFGIFPDPSFDGGSALGVRFKGEREKLASHALKICQTLMKAVLGDCRSVIDITLSAHVPFSEVTRGVSGLLELAGEGGGLWVEPLGHAAFFVILAVVEVRGDAVAVRVLAGGEGDTGG